LNTLTAARVAPVIAVALYPGVIRLDVRNSRAGRA
jgi:hypothetical protein